MNQLTMEKDRKLDHIKLAFESQTLQNEADQRYNYEPVISGHPERQTY
jgi:isopentenyl-diphosphate Delta-isomerase